MYISSEQFWRWPFSNSFLTRHYSFAWDSHSTFNNLPSLPLTNTVTFPVFSFHAKQLGKMITRMISFTINMSPKNKGSLRGTMKLRFPFNIQLPRWDRQYPFPNRASEIKIHYFQTRDRVSPRKWILIMSNTFTVASRTGRMEQPLLPISQEMPQMRTQVTHNSTLQETLYSFSSYH